MDNQDKKIHNCVTLRSNSVILAVPGLLLAERTKQKKRDNLWWSKKYWKWTICSTKPMVVWIAEIISPKPELFRLLGQILVCHVIHGYHFNNQKNVFRNSSSWNDISPLLLQRPSRLLCFHGALRDAQHHWSYTSIMPSLPRLFCMHRKLSKTSTVSVAFTAWIEVSCLTLPSSRSHIEYSGQEIQYVLLKATEKSEYVGPRSWYVVCSLCQDLESF